MISQNKADNTQNSAPASPTARLETETKEEGDAKSVNLTTENLIQGDNTNNLLKMGSNKQDPNVKVTNDTEGAQKLEIQENDQEKFTNQAEAVPYPKEQVENLSEKDGKKEETQKPELNTKEEKNENLKALSIVAQPSQPKPEELPPQIDQPKNSEI